MPSMPSLQTIVPLALVLVLALFASTIAAHVDVSKLDVSRFVERGPIVAVAAATSASPSASATTFACDNCVGYNALIQSCLATLTVSASTTVNQIQLPLLQCLCKQSGFYQVFGNCYACNGQAPLTPAAFTQQCQAIEAGTAIITSNPAYNVPVISFTANAGATATRSVLSKDPSTTSTMVAVTVPSIINGTLTGATATIPLDGVTSISTPTSTGINMVTSRGGMVVTLVAAVVIALAW